MGDKRTHAESADEASSAEGSDAIGKRLKLFWTDDQKWYTGTVLGFHPSTGKHRVVYDDGEKELVLLAKEKLQWLPDTDEVTRASAQPKKAKDSDL